MDPLLESEEYGPADDDAAAAKTPTTRKQMAERKRLYIDVWRDADFRGEKFASAADEYTRPTRRRALGTTTIGSSASDPSLRHGFRHRDFKDES